MKHPKTKSCGTVWRRWPRLPWDNTTTNCGTVWRRWPRLPLCVRRLLVNFILSNAVRWVAEQIRTCMIPVICPDQMVINDVALFEPHRMCPSACKRCQRIHDPNFQFRKLGLNKFFSFQQSSTVELSKSKLVTHIHVLYKMDLATCWTKNDMLYTLPSSNSKSAKRNRLERCTWTFLAADAHDDTVLCAVSAHTIVGVVTKYSKHFTSFNFK